MAKDSKSSIRMNDILREDLTPGVEAFAVKRGMLAAIIVLAENVEALKDAIESNARSTRETLAGCAQEIADAINSNTGDLRDAVHDLKDRG